MKPNQHKTKSLTTFWLTTTFCWIYIIITTILYITINTSILTTIGTFIAALIVICYVAYSNLTIMDPKQPKQKLLSVIGWITTIGLGLFMAIPNILEYNDLIYF